MDVEVEGRGDVGMAENDADGLVVAVAFDAAGGEAVAHKVKCHILEGGFTIKYK